MGLKMTTGFNSLEHEIDQFSRNVERAIIRTLMVAGEKAVNHARSLPSPSAADLPHPVPKHQPNYIDWTANLRSSIGYVVSAYGKIASESSFEPVRNGREGAEKGRAFARSLAAQFPETIALIIVAGERYASFVQDKGYDVIATATLLAEHLVKDELAKIKNSLPC